MNTANQLQISSNMRFLRKSFGYTQSDVAESLHISRSTYCLIEQGKRIAGLDFILDLAKIYGIKPCTLLELDEDLFVQEVSCKSEKGNNFRRLFEIYPKLTPFKRGRLIERAEELLKEKE